MYLVHTHIEIEIRCSNGQVDRSSNESLEFNASAGPNSLLYGLYVKGHMTLDDFSWTDP